MSDVRQKRLNGFFFGVIHEDPEKKRELKTLKDADRFIEAVCSQDVPVNCITSLVSGGLPAIQLSLRLRTDPDFLNGSANNLIKYIQAPDLRTICAGDYLRRIISAIVEPPIFWDSLVRAFLDDRLQPGTQQSFAWLLLELVSLPTEKAKRYYGVAQNDKIQNRLLESPQQEVRLLGHKIKHIVSNLTSQDITAEVFQNGPGGRHDNDDIDYREISILPTADELMSQDAPFLRLARAIDDAEEDKRLSMHLDNQFRLLREDMVGEMREELKIALGISKGRHRGMVKEGFSLSGIDCGPDNRRQEWCLKLKCREDLKQMANIRDLYQRINFLRDNKNIFKHQCLTCLLADGEVVAFPSINRNEKLLAETPPTVLLSFSGKASTTKALTKLKMAVNIKLVQIDTAVFSFEPILLRLQDIRSLELEDEVLCWKKGNEIQEPPSPPTDIIEAIEADPSQDLQALIGTPKTVNLDEAQSSSLLMGLKQRVGLIQGPPGTGKSFIGAILAKIFHDTSKRILVVTYTNHALDQFLEDLLKIGIPPESMVRLGGKSTPRTQPLGLSEQKTDYKLTRDSWSIISALKAESERLKTSLVSNFEEYKNSKIDRDQLLEYLEFLPEDPDIYEAFQLPEMDNDMTLVGRRGKAVTKYYLLDRWLGCMDAGLFESSISGGARRVWEMDPKARAAEYDRWEADLLREQAEEIYTIAEQYNDCQKRINLVFSEKDSHIMRSKRIVGCTTTAAAKYVKEIQAANSEVLLVEEAGEILESHILTALGPQTKQMVLIGDHKQLRPKVANYKLSVEKGAGYDLNRSLFERLVLKGYPHQTLSAQYRMRPEISDLIRHLTYPDLIDAPKTQRRANVRGLQDNLIFIEHNYAEDNNRQIKEKEESSVSSKQNTFEAQMVLKCVKYLGQQGYGTDKIVVLTPYLGQLHLLRAVLSKENDPVLNDLDYHDLVKAGLMPAAGAVISRNKLHISSIDNYQGEECDLVVVSFVRSNSDHDIGFMSAPERLNVLLSRARDGLIMIGNAETFMNARKGQDIYTKFFKKLKDGGHIYEGFPIQCDRHKDRKALLRKPLEFDEESPDGGCKEPCGTMLNCGTHPCPQRCHALFDHSKMECTFILTKKCSEGHTQSWQCYKAPPVSCQKCEYEAKMAEKKRQRDYDIQQKREAELRDHAKKMELLDQDIAVQRQKIKDEQSRRAREIAIQQKKKDLQEASQAAEDARNQATQAAKDSRNQVTQPTIFSRFVRPAISTLSLSNPPPSPQSAAPGAPVVGVNPPAQPANLPDVLQAQPPNTPGFQQPVRPAREPKPDTFIPKQSDAKIEWQRQKDMEGARNPSIDAIMEMIGLEEVKKKVLAIKSKIDTAIRQGTDVKKERFGISLLGNPGTGKTTVARHLAMFLATYHGVLPGTEFVETTGARLANDGVPGAKKILEGIEKAGGGAFFLDEAYQLTEKQSSGGSQVLDFLLAEIENTTGKIIFIFAGYNKQMEKFFEHNPGLPSRIPFTLQFDDYSDAELMLMLRKLILKKYNGRMDVEDGLGGLYMRIAVKRLGRGRGRDGYGNMRALENGFAKITERQAERLTRERKDGLSPDDFYMTKEDLIGPNPSNAILESDAWKKLQGLIGLETVKDSVRGMYERLETNYRRELAEKDPIQVPLNRVFLGSPGTGKTSVAKLYGRILADLGLLSNGEVVTKNPSDFIGDVLGGSEANTKAILATSVGKVLIIDEAYMLYSAGNGVGNHSDSFKTAVIDTIVAEVQSTLGEDRCVLLLGYKEQMETMFQNVNPGLSRRFAIEDAFTFQDFTNGQLRQILELKLKQQDLDATEDAKDVACEKLGRERDRSNFGNGGAVENHISAAKARYQKRISKVPTKDRPIDIIFEPMDFDPEFNRGSSAVLNCKKLFENVIGCEDVVAKLEGYQQAAINSKANGLDPREIIPMNFVFKGPPGTGKTTTARKMGKVFYDMGFLSSADVVESSATDFVGQYIGQTGPKTQKLLEKALGKVLFIDEAYRLAEGHFAKEAVDELVDVLTKPKFLGKIVVILAGYDNDMNRLLAVNPGLGSRFPEEIYFHNMPPKNCLELLEDDLKKKKIASEALKDRDSPAYSEILELVTKLSGLPSWGNARDVKTLAKTMVGMVYKAKSTEKTGLVISANDTISCIKTFIAEREARENTSSSSSSTAIPDITKTLRTLPPPGAPPPPNIATEQAAPKQKQTSARPAPARPTPARPTPARPTPARPTSASDSVRDQGVTDEVWAQLCADKAAEEARVKRVQKEVEQRKKDIAKLEARDAEQRALAEKLELQIARDDAEELERRRKLEEARLAEARAKMARDKALAEFERRRAQERRKIQEEVKAQRKLKEMGVCSAGYRWIKQTDGYRCAGGFHFVSKSQLGI